MGRMKELIADEWDLAYRQGFTDGVAAALAAVETLQSQQQTAEMQGDEKLIELINLGGEQP
jgi:hypothetical protein